jgi:hypothetical protein
VLANSALLSLSAGLALALSGLFDDTMPVGVLIFAFAAAAGVFLTLSLALYVRWLFYGFLATIGLAGVLFKLAFFSGPSVGTVEVLIALALWCLTWWLDHQSQQSAALEDQPACRERLTLLWLFPTGGAEPADYVPPMAPRRSSANRAEKCERVVQDTEEPTHVQV